MIISSVLSSTKDNSIQNNTHKKKKLFLNTSTKNPPNINNNSTANINNIKQASIKPKPQKKKIILENNAIYEGYLLNNELDGYGELRSPNYNYFGFFSHGKKNGKGKLEDFVNKYEYNGDFKDNMKEGFGEEKYHDGSVYIGEFKQNMKNGKGKLVLGGGKNYGYCGMFRNDKICGKGKFIWNENKEYIGDWENNEISGYGIIQEEKLRHVGFFKRNIKEGFGATFYVEQNLVLLGKWDNDLIEGFAVLINLSENNNNNNNISGKIDINNEIIVAMNKGEITNMSLEEEEINKYKNSKEYKDMMQLFQDKFYLDYIKYTKEKEKKEK